MLGIAFNFHNRAFANTGKKSATHAAVGTIGFFPALDYFVLNFSHAWLRKPLHLDHERELERFSFQLTQFFDKFRQRLRLAIPSAESIEPGKFLDDEQLLRRDCPIDYCRLANFEQRKRPLAARRLAFEKVQKLRARLMIGWISDNA